MSPSAHPSRVTRSSDPSLTDTGEHETRPEKQRRGFALLDPERVRTLSQKCGRAAHSAGVAHQYTVEEARAAGKKGGATTAKARRKTPLAAASGSSPVAFAGSPVS